MQVLTTSLRYHAQLGWLNPRESITTNAQHSHIHGSQDKLQVSQAALSLSLFLFSGLWCCCLRTRCSVLPSEPGPLSTCTYHANRTSQHERQRHTAPHNTRSNGSVHCIKVASIKWPWENCHISTLPLGLMPVPVPVLGALRPGPCLLSNCPLRRPPSKASPMQLPAAQEVGQSSESSPQRNFTPSG